ncbi:hypothetical protein [Chlamydia caviae]|uniref:Uncharacterized protein n=1 Tax=Chlamydia caviae (strain ATCC VR-813 / DSM 19441 / 03DC25 / GPIC) TaxID=227941 RepID=Q822X1_CHLCV|nr:hypothetical protein [Chlamydia caviae]AAP05300.1 hypothetical protein CCA_00557 [Chlamydia caviae GPIC]
MAFINSILGRQVSLENIEPKKSLCQSKPLVVCGSIIGCAIPIIFVILGALGLASCASLPLLILGGLGLSFIVLGAIAFSAFLIAVKVCLKTPREPEDASVGASVGARVDIDPIGAEALKFAAETLDAERSRIEPITCGYLRPPIDDDIRYLCALRGERHNQFLNLLRIDDSRELSFPDDQLWTDPEFTRVSTEFLQLSYAISVRSLLDLENYRAAHQDATSNLEALARQNSIYYKTFYMMSTAYSLLRHTYMYCRDSASQEHIEARRARFYQPGSIENQWRLLYNDFCRQARSYLGDPEEADIRECRLIKHSTCDLDPSFHQQGTTPT